MPTLDQLLASGRNYVSYGAGAATAFGIMSTTNQADLITDFDHIFNGIKEIAIGIGPLIAIGTGWWAAHRSSPAVQVATVSAMPEVKQITTSSPELAMAAKQGDPLTEVKVVPNA